ncbi:hypothetical protein [uncultured Methanobrevibacter sp.]|uniref:hypothetical protein n=1 Tax=uncultured Methanobrevibacter sp. TaxID=253161 RepID=UPI0025CBE2A4|nr:hypothetical protein [uncultured Methanobrevibacter sp.]
MTNKCKPKYKNLGLIQSYADQRYAVLQFFEQACMNDEFLMQQCEKLKYLSPPAMRHRFVYPEDIDPRSYGWEISTTKEHEIVMSNSQHKLIEIDNFNESNINIDFLKSDCSFESYVDSGGLEKERVVCSTNPIVEKDYSNFFKNEKGVNSYWYVGYDKSKPYYISKNWVNNWKNKNIPSVVRAQTFECKMDDLNETHSDLTEAWLKSITLSIQNTGEMTHNWTSPLYVQIWPTIKKFAAKSTWDKQLRKAKYQYIKYADLKKKAQASAEEIAAGQYQENYDRFSRFEEYDKKVKYTSGKHKGEYKKDSQGNYITEKAYRKATNGIYVVEREFIYFPKTYRSNAAKTDSIYLPLAEGKFDPAKTTPNWYTIPLNKTCKLKKGNHYAIVMFSPLSHPSHCPRIGGYGRNCNQTKYDKGDAFLSEDNGRSFIRYGYNDPELSKDEYKFGMLTPQDFAFELELNYSEDAYTTNTDSYLYLKPILSNPIKSFHIEGRVTGETEMDRSRGLTVQLQYSVEGGNDNWHDINLGEEKYFSSDDLPQLLHVRAKLNTTDPKNTPDIEWLKIHLETDVAQQMYVRTSMFSPASSLILGPHIWGRVFAPFEVTPSSSNIQASVEIIENKRVTEHIDIVEICDLEDYVGLKDNNGNFVLDDSIVDMDDDERVEYLLDNPSILQKLKNDVPNKSIYIKPYTLNEVEYYLSFEDEGEDGTYGGVIKLRHSPAYPMIESVFRPQGNNSPFSLGEWYDYTIDYDKDILTIDEAILDSLPTGVIQLDFNPIFIQGLLNEEVGIRVDEKTGLTEEGLILDYFKQSFIIGEKNVETRSIDLKAIPLCPIREVILNKENDERELYENIDFTVDYEQKKMIFPIKDDDTQASILKLNDTVDVVYTPELRSDGLAIGYWVKRSSTEYNVNIKPSYLEYK